METTKITQATVRIALSYNYSTFEISSQLENQEGVSVDDIKAARQNCQLLATEALNEYKIQPNSNPKEELKKIENKIAALKKMVQGSEPEKIDPAAIEAIQNMPEYTPKPVKKPTKKV